MDGNMNVKLHIMLFDIHEHHEIGAERPHFSYWSK
jgi:hypothetical protein